MAKKKVKKTNRIKLACTLVQLYARLRDTDNNGNGRCCSCGKQLTWGEGQGGHWHPKTRGYNAACLIRENVNMQCSTCNLYRQGDIANYTQHMISMWGPDVIEGIRAVSHQTLDKDKVEEQIVVLRGMCKLLAQKKNFTVKVP